MAIVFVCLVAPLSASDAWPGASSGGPQKGSLAPVRCGKYDDSRRRHGSHAEIAVRGKTDATSAGARTNARPHA